MNKAEIREVLLFLCAIAGLISTLVLYKKQNQKPADITYVDQKQGEIK